MISHSSKVIEAIQEAEAIRRVIASAYKVIMDYDMSYVDSIDDFDTEPTKVEGNSAIFEFPADSVEEVIDTLSSHDVGFPADESEIEAIKNLQPGASTDIGLSRGCEVSVERII